MSTTKLAHLDTILGADSITLVGEARSTDEKIQQTAVIGTYQLSDNASENRKRHGALLFVQATRHITEDSDREMTDTTHRFSLESISTLDDIPGVLDVTSCDPHQPSSSSSSLSSTTLLAACAESCLQAVTVESGANPKVIHASNVIPLDEYDADRIMLSVDAVAENEESTLAAVSDSHGAISVLRSSKGGVQHVGKKKLHGQEAWTTFLDEEAMTIYSGGDDGALCGWKVGCDETMFRLRKAHAGVGVTTVTKNRRDGSAFGGWSLWSGGYDDVVRVWDLRSMRKCVSEVGVGGGVWRVRFHPNDASLLLVACMYDGFKVVKVEDGSCQLKILCDYRGHDSLGYGACWMAGLDTEEERVAVTGSFYDHCVQMWSVGDCRR